MQWDIGKKYREGRYNTGSEGNKDVGTGKGEKMGWMWLRRI